MWVIRRRWAALELDVEEEWDGAEAASDPLEEPDEELESLRRKIDITAFQVPCRGRHEKGGRRMRAAAREIRNFGAGNGTRTRDIKLGKLALYQLSYARSIL